MNSGKLQMEFRVSIRGHQNHEDPPLESLPVSMSEFMSLQPRSSYTSFCSIGNATKLFNLNFHCHRLIEGLKALESSSRSPTSPELKAALKKSISSIVRLSAVPPDTEMQFVVVLRSEECEPYLRIHASLVPSATWDQQTFDFVVAECQKGQRHHPAVKDTSWYSERVPFEQMRSKNTKETILVGDDEGVPVFLEGLITNFFVVTDDLEIWTADEKFVLSGSMKDLVVRACEEMNVTVVEKAVPLPSWRKYQAAFVTNARRLLQPVSTIKVPPSVRTGLSDVPSAISFPEESEAVNLVKRLRQRVIHVIDRIAEDIC